MSDEVESVDVPTIKFDDEMGFTIEALLSQYGNQLTKNRDLLLVYLLAFALVPKKLIHDRRFGEYDALL